MTQEQFEFTAKVVWAVLEPWLKLQFGEKCEEFELNCECCKRWKLAEQLLAYDWDNPKTLEAEIATLEECLAWRRELLEKYQAQA